MRQLQIMVFNSMDARTSNRPVFERIIDINESLTVPYDSLVSDLKFLFGSSVIIQFAVL